MKKINNIFDCLENAEGSEMERITNKTPKLDDKQLERILKMSERKYNIKKRNEINADYNDGYQTEAEGVEEYKRPVWFRFAATAAAIVLAGGVVTAGWNILRNRNEVPVVQPIPNVAATTVEATTVTTDLANADVTTVSADTSAETSGTLTADGSTEASTQTNAAVSSTQTAPQNQNNAQTPAQQTENTTAAPNILTEDQCREVVNKYYDDHIIYEEIVQVPCKEYLDFSDTFMAKGVFTNDAYSEGHPLLDTPEEFDIKFVHYVDPKFNSVADIRNFVHDHADRYNGGRGYNEDKMFGQSIVPGSVITNDIYIPECFFVYTEYNGKIYRGMSPDLSPDSLQTHDQFYTSELMALRWGHDYFRNITDHSFEVQRVESDGNGGYRGRSFYCWNDGTNWRIDASKDAELSDNECRDLLD